MPAIDGERIPVVQDRVRQGKQFMLIRCDDGRGCEGVKDAAEEKEHGYECQEQCEAYLYEAKGTWVDGALQLQNCVP